MATGFTDFSEYPVGLQPNDWTAGDNVATWEVSLSQDAVGGKVLALTGGGTSNEYSSLLWDEGDYVVERQNIELLCRWRRVSGSFINNQLIARYDPDGYDRDDQSVWIDTYGDNARLCRESGGSFNSNAASDTVSDYTSFFYTRFRADEGTIYGKHWPGTLIDEPDGWQNSWSVGVTSAGRIGVGVWETVTMEVDWISYATEGHTPPTPGVRRIGPPMVVGGLR